MSWSEHDLRLTFLASLAAPPSADCPSPEAIWDALNMTLPPEQRYAIILHTSQCRHCAQAWQAAKLIGEEHRRGTSPAPLTKPADRWWRRWLAAPVLAPALAGAAALLVALVWLGPTDPGPVPPPVDSGVMRGLKSGPELLTPDGAEMTTGAELTWRAVAGATHHRVVMFSPDGELRLDLPAADHLLLDNEVIETFGPGHTVHWYVVAIDGNGPGAESEVRRFTLSGAE